MMENKTTPLEQKDAKCNIRFRMIELIVCLSCLTIFIALVLFCSIPVYMIAIILTIAGLTSIIVTMSIFVMIQSHKKPKIHIRFHWAFIALASMICYIACVPLFIILPAVAIPWLLMLSLAMAVVTAVVFLFDLIFNIRNIIRNKKKARRNQVMPSRLIAVQQTPENLPASNENYSMVECSVIVGDQLACNKQICHVKWSGDQASSSPTPKLIYVQPCTSTVVNKICPACKKLNCEQCFKKEKHEPIAETKTEIKSTQFPEDNENICPLCPFKAVKVYKTAFTQTEQPVSKPISENIITRNAHSAKSIEKPSSVENKLIQSSPVTPRNTLECIKICPKCRKRSKFVSSIKENHLCPLCYQECTSKFTCISCGCELPAFHLVEDQSKKNSAVQTEAEYFAEKKETPVQSRGSSPRCFKSSRLKKENCQKQEESRRNSPAMVANEMVQVSPEDFEKKPSYAKRNEDKVVQVSSNDFIQELSPKKREEIKLNKCEIAVQVSVNDLTERCPAYDHLLRKRVQSEATVVSSKECLEEMEMMMLGETSAEKIFENKFYENRSSIDELNENVSTQVSSSDFLQKEKKSTSFGKVEKQMSLVSSRDFVQKERRPCGAPNCTQLSCGGRKQAFVDLFKEKQKFDEVAQTEGSKKNSKAHAEKETLSKQDEQIPENVKQKATTDLFKQQSCQTTQSLEATQSNPNSPSLENKRKEEISKCLDSDCKCIINAKEILVCAHCQSVPNCCDNAKPNHQNEIHAKHNCNDEIENRDYQKEMQSNLKNDKCFCIYTEKGLLTCTFCENHERQKGKGGIIFETDMPSSSSSTCCQEKAQELVQTKKMHSNQVENTEHSTQTGNTEQIKKLKSSRKTSKDEKQKNKSLEISEKNENKVLEDDYAFSVSISEIFSNELEEKRIDDKYSPQKEMKSIYKKERENMAYLLANKDAETFAHYSPPPPDAMKNVAVFTLENQIQIMEIQNRDSDTDETDEPDDSIEKMKSEWEALAARHAAYHNRIKKQAESSINFGEEKISYITLKDESMEMYENKQSEIQNIYNCMIKSLLETQAQKENNLFFLEKLNFDTDSDAGSSKQHTDSSGINEDELINLESRFKRSAFLRLDYPKFNFDVETREHIGTTKEEMYKNDDEVFLEIKEINPRTITSEIMMSENVSLSTITEEMSVASSDLISISKKSESSKSQEQVQEKHTEKEFNLNATYCIKIPKIIDAEVKLQKNKEEDKTFKNFPIKPVGLFEPFILSPTFGSTKTSFTTSDNESTVDSMQQDKIKTLQSTGSTTSFYLQEDISPKEEKFQSQSVPITSRASTSKSDNTKKVVFGGHSIPCTPKNSNCEERESNSSKTSTKIDGRHTFRKESEYGEDDTSSIIIKNFHPETYEQIMHGNEFAMNPKIVSPLPIANLTPEISESDESRPISCNSQFSARTLQAIDHYHLECMSSINDFNCTCFQKRKQSKKSSGIKSQPISTRPFVEKQKVRKTDVKYIMDPSLRPTIRERRISAPPRSDQRKVSPKPSKTKSVTSRTLRQKTATLTPSKTFEKRKSSTKLNAKKSKIKSGPASAEYVCHCEFYKNSKINYCKIHGMGAHPKVKSVSVTHKSNKQEIENIKTPAIISKISPKQSPKSPKRKSITPKTSSERPKSSTERRIMSVVITKRSSERAKTSRDSSKKSDQSGEMSSMTEET